MIESTQGKRYNKGKNRYSLLPTNALRKVTEVYTKGAHKYSTYVDEKGNVILGKDIPFNELSSKKLTLLDDGANNWRKGMPFMDLLDSHQRHIEAYKALEDIDPELKTHHLANAIFNLMAILELEDYMPHLDNRVRAYEYSYTRIALDIDGVLADFVGAWQEKFNVKEVPEHWNFDINFKEKLFSVKEDKDFWLNIKPLCDPKSIPFEPACYVTSRIIPNEWSKEWLDKWGFPTTPVFTVGHDKSKVDILLDNNIDIFVDDRYENIIDILRQSNSKGRRIHCYLYDAKYNRRYTQLNNIRITDLQQIVHFN